MKATYRPGLAKALFEDDVPPSTPGEYDITTESGGQRRFWFVCPGCSMVAAIAIRPVVDGSQHSWEWNQNMEQPTLMPSINHVDCWHGWLTNGEFIGA